MKDLSLHVLDIVQNSVRAEADTIKVTLELAPEGKLMLLVEDDGRGMDAELLTRVGNPFVTTRTTRKVGLGIPLLKQNAEQAGGSLEITSEPGRGTLLKADFVIRHPVCPPVGDLPEVASLMMVSTPDFTIIFTLKSLHDESVWNSEHIRETLDGLSIQDPEIREGLRDWFQSDYQLFKQNLLLLS